MDTGGGGGVADVIRLPGGGTYIICNDRDALELLDERLGMDMRRWLEDRLSEDDGADDYIAKPFRPRELISRIRNILRLTGKSNTAITLGSVTVDTVKGTAEKDGHDLYLSALEYRLLLLLINNRGMVMTRTMLLESLWDAAGEFVSDNTLTVYIKRLRDKLEDDPQNPQIIRTVRGMGYKVE